MNEFLWLILESAFGPLLEQLRSRPMNAGEQRVQPRSADGFSRAGRVAIVRLRGALMKSEPYWMDGTSSKAAIAAIRQAAGDDSIDSILLHVESPGGTASGTPELAEAVWQARGVKRVVAYIEDVGASAAYFAASQATEIVCNATAHVGSIGTYMVVDDWSGFYERAGVKTHVLSTGKFKGAGVQGSVVTDEQLAAWQENVDQVNERFLEAVARGRGMSIAEVRKLADGRVHVGEKALALGLVDRIAAFEQVITEMSHADGLRATASFPQGENQMKFSQAQIELMRSFGLAADATDAQTLEFFTRTCTEEQKARVAACAAAPAAPAAAVASTTEPAPEPKPAPAQAEPVDINGAVATALTAERNRVAAIRQLAGEHQLGDAWAEKHARIGTALAQARELAAEVVELRTAWAPVSGVSVGADRNQETLGVAIEDAVLLAAGERLVAFERDARSNVDVPKRADGGGFVARQPHDRARQFVGRSLLEMGEQWLRSNGVDTAGMSKPQIAKLLFDRRRQAQMSSGLTHSTGDFTDILAVAANKTLQMGYVEFQGNWNQWARENASIKDFRPVNRKALSGFTTPPQVVEGAEYTFVTAADAGETYTLAKYGQVFQLTWETLINDDLDAFSRIPRMHGAACARLEDDLAYAQLTSNPTMASDSTALFDASGHSNYTSSGTALSVTSLGVARGLMRKQTGRAGELIDVQPMALLVPVAKETIADQLINSTVDPAKSNATPNPFSGRLKVVANPRLDANSGTAWYLAASPAQIDTVEVGFLQGYRQPTLDEEDGFMSDGRKYKARHVCAAGVLDHRGLYKNAGA